MSDLLNIFRHQRRTVALALLPIILSFHVGCRIFSSNKPAPPILAPAPQPQFSPGMVGSDQPPASLFGGPPSSTAPIVDPLPERAEAFRPIIPEHLVSETVKSDPVIVSRSSTPEPAPIVQPAVQPNTSQPDTSKIQIDGLNQRIEQLERALAESETRNRFKRPLPDPPSAFSAGTTEVAKPPSKLPRPVPTFNIDGVATASEGDGFRIEISDRVLFIPGTWQLNPEFEGSLRKIVGEIRANDPDASLDIEGHTDSLIVDPINVTQKHDVSSLKSMVVMQYFIKALQWPAERIKTSSHGPSRPVADNGTPEGRARNNRIEIVVLPNG